MLPTVLRDKMEMIGNDSRRQTRQAGNIVLELWKIKSPQESKDWKYTIFFASHDKAAW